MDARKIASAPPPRKPPRRPTGAGGGEERAAQLTSKSIDKSSWLRPRSAGPFLVASAMLTSPRRPFQHDADLLFGRMVPTGISTDVPDCLYGVCYSPRWGYDEPKILSYAIHGKRIAENGHCFSGRGNEAAN